MPLLSPFSVRENCATLLRFLVVSQRLVVTCVAYSMAGGESGALGSPAGAADPGGTDWTLAAHWLTPCGLCVVSRCLDQPTRGSSGACIGAASECRWTADCSKNLSEGSLSG